MSNNNLEKIVSCINCEKDFASINSCNNHLKKCNPFIRPHDFILTKEFLTKEYFENKKSLLQISKETKINICSIQFRLEKYNITVRSHSEAGLLVVDKRNSTNLERYGFKNLLEAESPFKIKIEKEYLLDKGVTNFFQLESVKERIKEVLLDKYGVDNPLAVPEFKEKYKATMQERHGVSSGVELMKKGHFPGFTKPHRKVMDILEIMGFQPKAEKVIHENEKMFFADIWFEKFEDLLIEINGDYFHGFPGKYRADDIVAYGVLAKDVWAKDAAKLQMYDRQGYKVLILWEHEIKNKLFPIKTKLQEFIESSSFYIK